MNTQLSTAEGTCLCEEIFTKQITITDSKYFSKNLINGNTKALYKYFDWDNKNNTIICSHLIKTFGQVYLHKFTTYNLST